MLWVRKQIEVDGPKGPIQKNLRLMEPLIGDSYQRYSRAGPRFSARFGPVYIFDHEMALELDRLSNQARPGVGRSGKLL